MSISPQPSRDLVSKAAVREMLNTYEVGLMMGVETGVTLQHRLDALPVTPAITEAEARERLTDDALDDAFADGEIRTSDTRNRLLTALFPSEPKP